MTENQNSCQNFDHVPLHGKTGLQITAYFLLSCHPNATRPNPSFKS